MKTLFTLAVLLFAAAFTPSSQAQVQTIIFHEDFESATALSQWQVAPNGGRARVVEDTRSISNHGLLLDDPTNDVVFSHNVVTRNVSIAGFAGVRLTIDILSLSDEPHSSTNAFDGVILRGGGLIRIYPFQQLTEQ